MQEYIKELCDAFRALGIIRKFYDVACRMELEVEKELLGGGI